MPSRRSAIDKSGCISKSQYDDFNKCKYTTHLEQAAIKLYWKVQRSLTTNFACRSGFLNLDEPMWFYQKTTVNDGQKLILGSRLIGHVLSLDLGEPMHSMNF